MVESDVDLVYAQLGKSHTFCPFPFDRSVTSFMLLAAFLKQTVTGLSLCVETFPLDNSGGMIRWHIFNKKISSSSWLWIKVGAIFALSLSSLYCKRMGWASSDWSSFSTMRVQRFSSVIVELMLKGMLLHLVLTTLHWMTKSETGMSQVNQEQFQLTTCFRIRAQLNIFWWPWIPWLWSKSLGSNSFLWTASGNFLGIHFGHAIRFTVITVWLAWIICIWLIWVIGIYVHCIIMITMIVFSLPFSSNLPHVIIIAMLKKVYDLLVRDGKQKWCAIYKDGWLWPLWLAAALFINLRNCH